VGRELAKIVPLALAAAVNPTGLCVLIALLATAKRAAAALTAGFCLVFIALGVVVLGLGVRMSTGHHGTASAVIDLTAAGLVFGLGLRSLLKHRGKAAGEPAKDPPQRRRLGLAGGFVAGLGLAVTDVTSLIPYGIALKDLSRSDLGVADVATADALFLVIALMPMLLPVALSFAAPGASARLLTPVNRALTRHGNTIVGVVCIVLAAYLLLKGLRGL